MRRRFRDALTERGRRGWLAVLTLAAALAGVIIIGVAAAAQQVAPEPPSASIGAVPTSTVPAIAPTHTGPHPGATRPSTKQPSGEQTSTKKPTPTHRPTAAAHPGTGRNTHPDKADAHPGKSEKAHPGQQPRLLLPASKPVHLSISAIGVNTDLTTVGLTSADAIDVPHGKQINEAAWFDHSPTPGQYGPAVIVGHIDTVNGPSVFFRLGALRPGDTITITRADHTTATFTVDGLSQYPNRTRLPIQAIYGGDLDRAGLRLITCTNFDSSIGHYLGNTVVFAHLTSISR